MDRGVSREVVVTPWEAADRTAEGYVLCSGCGAMMVDVTEDGDNECEIDVYWCPRCGQALFLDARGESSWL